ncbi:alpha/beta hydrolase [Sphingomicrobium astaxanthinifaciens]|uniref:alpha/beta hydrolase n=1 Tax=Sphingomicrobium astaxanthinifaciens TaxID=1227949 RepID=UPI001FCB133A|nr:alpha/beta hydrolase [Sphingomicrobium astaxanthinifaciens]MCJ7421044.1 alpha/beta hydrolase [Sphingomicrobium astaxanthinifaciens]
MRFLLILAAMVAASPALAQDRQGAIAIGERTVALYHWTPAGEPTGTILFGHGHGAHPARYAALLDGWRDAGWAVVAAMPVDSIEHPARADYDLQGGFRARVETMQALRAMLATEYPDRPMLLAGHSFGSFMALLGAGARTRFGPPLEGPPVAGVIAFSTAGAMEQVIDPQAYAGLDVPLLLITGTADADPAYAPRWTDHRLAFDTSRAGDKLLLVVEAGGHDLARMDQPVAPSLAAFTRLFLAAHGAGDAAAGALLDRLGSSARIAVERR